MRINFFDNSENDERMKLPTNYSMAIPKIISPKTQILDVITRGDSNGLSDLLLSPSFPNINRLLDGVRHIFEGAPVHL